MPDEQTEPFAAVGVSLTRNDRIIGNLADPDLAEWVAEACNTLAEMEAAQSEWEASGEAPHCSMVEVDGEAIRVNARLETDEDRTAMSEVVRPGGAACHGRDQGTSREAGVLAEFRRYLDDDFRQWCRPHGIAADYAKALIKQLDQIAAKTPAVAGEFQAVLAIERVRAVLRRKALVTGREALKVVRVADIETALDQPEETP